MNKQRLVFPLEKEKMRAPDGAMDSLVLGLLDHLRRLDFGSDVLNVTFKRGEGLVVVLDRSITEGRKACVKRIVREALSALRSFPEVDAGSEASDEPLSSSS